MVTVLVAAVLHSYITKTILHIQDFQFIRILAVRFAIHAWWTLNLLITQVN